MMIKIRETEEEIARKYTEQNEMPDTSINWARAVPSVLSFLSIKDLAVSSHRGHAHCCKRWKFK